MIPIKEQWEYALKGLDKAHAFDHFYGKTLKEAEDMLHDCPEKYCEDFYWMPKVAFRFYLKAFKRYLISSRSINDAYAADYFIMLIEHCIKCKYDWIEDSWQSVFYVLNKLANHQQNFYDPLMKPDKFRKRADRTIEKLLQKRIETQ